MESRKKPESGLKKFLVGKGAESECPFHRMNSRIYEGVAGIFRRKGPLEEAPESQRKEDDA